MVEEFIYPQPEQTLALYGNIENTALDVLRSSQNSSFIRPRVRAERSEE